MRRPKPDRFVNWKKVETPTCDLVANSVLPHTKGQVAVCSYRSEQNSVFNVCENCDSYIRAAKWLAEHGKEPSETTVAAAARVVKTGEYAFVPSPGSAHMTQNVFHHLSKWAKDGLLTKRTVSDSVKDRSVVVFRLVPSEEESDST